MPLKWDIPTTGNNAPKGHKFGELNAHDVYNMKFVDAASHRVYSPENSNVKSGFLGIFKLKTTNGNKGVGTYVQLMLNIDEEGTEWIETKKDLIRRVAKAAGLDRLQFPSEPEEVMAYLVANLSGKEISGTVREAKPYNGNKQWSLDGWGVEKPRATFTPSTEGDIIDQDAIEPGSSKDASDFDFT